MQRYSPHKQRVGDKKDQGINLEAGRYGPSKVRVMMRLTLTILSLWIRKIEKYSS